MSYVAPYNKEDEVRALIKSGKLLDAIVLLRKSNTGLHLVDAKNIVESWRDGATYVPPGEIACGAAKEMQSFYQQMTDARIIQKAIGEVFATMPLPPSDIGEFNGDREYIEAIHEWRRSHGYPVPDPLRTGIDVGEGWRWLEEGEPLQPGDGFWYPALSGAKWIDHACRPDIFRGAGKEGTNYYIPANETAHTYAWRRRINQTNP